MTGDPDRRNDATEEADLDKLIEIVEALFKRGLIGQNDERVRAVTGIDSEWVRSKIQEAICFAIVKGNKVPTDVPDDLFPRTHLGHIILDSWLLGLEMGREFTMKAVGETA